MFLSRFAAGLLVLLLVAALVDLSAHLAVTRTSPTGDAVLATSPDRIQVWFSQQPSPRVSRLELAGPSGAVTLGELDVNARERTIAAALPEPLPAGRYEVSWRTAGDDGHVLRGTFAFTVRPAE